MPAKLKTNSAVFPMTYGISWTYASFFKTTFKYYIFKTSPSNSKIETLSINYKIAPRVTSDSLNGIFH